MRTLVRSGWLLGPTVRRFRVAIVVAGLAVAAFCGGLSTASAIADHQVDRPDGLGARALRSVDLASYGQTRDPRALTGAAIHDVASLSHVEGASGWTQSNIALYPGGGDGETGAIGTVLTSRVAWVQPRLVSGSEPSGPDQIVLGLSTLHALHAAVGDVVILEHIARTLDGDGSGTGVQSGVRVVGSYDDSLPSLDGPGAAYGAPPLLRLVVADERGQSTAWFDQNYVYPKAYALVDSANDVDAVVRALQARGFGASSLASLLSGLTVTEQFLESVSAIAVAVLCTILIVIAWLLGSAILTSRRPAIGLLIALGWRPAQVAGMFIAVLAAIGLLVGASGAVVGSVVGVAGGLMTVGTPFAAHWYTFLLLALATPVVTFTVVPLISVWRLARTNPDVTLRDRIGP